jgi:putative ABC transport system ATP-binding protein
MNTPVAIDARQITRTYRRGRGQVNALRGVDLIVGSGERVAIMGPSGCGKSTLLGIIGGLDRPTSGSLDVVGHDLIHSSPSEITHFRRTSIGYILQTPSLLPMLTALENVELPLALNGVDTVSRTTRAHELLLLVGLEGKAHSLPEELSGGQQQRVSVARALAMSPRLILADEPGGSLDTATAEEVLSLLTHVVAEHSLTLVMVTHERSDARYVDRIVEIHDGMVVRNERAS